MVELSDLWIGDLLRLRKSGRVGKFEGVKNGKAKINIDGKTVLTPPSNIDVYKEKEPDIDLGLKEQINSENEITFEPIIDLHMEALNPSLLHGRPERILDIQIKVTKEHIEMAIQKRQHLIEIIHGKGTGVLRSEVHHLLSLYSEVKYHLPTRNGGGTEVTFHY